jgi:hypothetical protein
MPSSFHYAAVYLLLLGDVPSVISHGWASMRNEDGENIESRNSVAWKNGAGYPNPQGMSQTNSPTRPMYCGGLGQTGFSRAEHDSISAPDALKKAKDSGFATRLRKGSNFTLQNFITANHGGVAALYYSCPDASVDTPEEYNNLNWKALTPIKDSYPEGKRNGVGFSDKMPEWYGFAGSICNFGAGYTGGVIRNCDDCQLRYGGPETTAAWNAEKPPSGAPLGTGQLATIVDIEYELPADFECSNAVFSWIWHTPHLCIPKEVADKRAENDFWKFCDKNLEGYYGACRTEWQDEIFSNCIDAEVVGDGVTGGSAVPAPNPQPVPASPPAQAAPSPPPSPALAPLPPPPSAPVLAPAPAGDCVSSGPAYYTAACAALAATCDQYSFCKRVQAGSSTPATVSPMGACVSNDPNVDYTVACKALEATCEQWSFCKRVSSLIQSSIHSTPVRRLRWRGPSDHVLVQQGDLMQDTVVDVEDEIEYTGETRLGSEASLVASPSRSEL